MVSDPICLARFTRHVRRLCVGPIWEDPLAWFDRLLRVAQEGEVEVDLPTQEQVAVLSHQLPRLVAAGMATAVPAVRRRCCGCRTSSRPLHTLAELDIPQPRTAWCTPGRG